MSFLVAGLLAKAWLMVAITPTAKASLKPRACSSLKTLKVSMGTGIDPALPLPVPPLCHLACSGGDLNWPPVYYLPL
jgi:hypothetical protein